MGTVAILPVKSFSNAKQRLDGGLSPELRSKLAEAMVNDVLESLCATTVDLVLVVTAGESVAAIAHRHGAVVLTDEERGHNAAACVGIREAIHRGADSVLLVPGDCPALDSAEVDQLLARAPGQPSAIIVPDRHGTGTNALLITPPDALRPSFGPGSCQRHVALAAEAGIFHQVVRIPSLALDIDTPEDLAALGELPDRGFRTLELLSRC